jgi:hypothetical protein
MVNEILANSAPAAYAEALWKMPHWVHEEQSRNGPVLTCLQPTMLTILRPEQRVIFDPIRRANPYFHVMEFIWMMAGDNSTEWISQFNKGFRNYAEYDGRHHGAYGHRWREHFGIDQIMGAIDELSKDPASRRVVLGMWDPAQDWNGGKKDLPCNTHIYLRIHKDRLHMTVCNRSNDLIWGMLGSNIVHMTLLQEFLANALGVQLGRYHTFTNNLHIYPGMPRFNEIWGSKGCQSLDEYQFNDWNHVPVLGPEENARNFLDECWAFIHTPKDKYQSNWLEHVATPMYMEYMRRLGVLPGEKNLWIPTIQADDWRRACQLWETWHGPVTGTSVD